MCGMSMLTAMCMDYEASESWYRVLQSYAAGLQKTDAKYKYRVIMMRISAAGSS